jgi:hypothetical protein
LKERLIDRINALFPFEKWWNVIQTKIHYKLTYLLKSYILILVVYNRNKQR